MAGLDEFTPNEACREQRLLASICLSFAETGLWLEINLVRPAWHKARAYLPLNHRTCERY